MITWIDVSSSNVLAVGFENTTNEICVRFNNGSEYAYPGTEKEYNDILKTPSVGGYVSNVLKHRRFRKL